MSGLNISDFIWSIADDVLRDVYVRGKYRDVILPMTVIRRLDTVLDPTKDAVLGMSEQLDRAGVANQHAALCRASGEAFYNVSPFRLRDLASRARRQTLKADFEAYLDGFSSNVEEVLDKFRFRNQIPTLAEADALRFLIERFLDPAINLGPRPVQNQDGSVRLPGLDNHSMGTIFEELIRRRSPSSFCSRRRSGRYAATRQLSDRSGSRPAQRRQPRYRRIVNFHNPLSSISPRSPRPKQISRKTIAPPGPIANRLRGPTLPIGTVTYLGLAAYLSIGMFAVTVASSLSGTILVTKNCQSLRFRSEPASGCATSTMAHVSR